MTVFKTFLNVLKANRTMVILYTVILIVFGGANMQTSDNPTNFVATKPDVLIVNHDENKGITKGLIDYFKKNANIVKVKQDENAIKDALFYRDINYVIYIPKDFRKDFMAGKNPTVEVESTADYSSSLAERMLQQYINIANLQLTSYATEDELIESVDKILAKETKVHITSKLDTTGLSKAAFYYNFANYSLLAGCVFVICMILTSFKEEKIRKRTIISSMNYKTHNRQLLLSNGLFAVVLWFFYVILSFFMVGDAMFSIHGILLIANSFVFTFCALTIAFLIAELAANKNAINGIVNVLALGSSFLCGAFVPMQFLPNFVLKIAHIFPSYYYIANNETIATLEAFHFESLKPVITNMAIMLIFSVIFIVITNIVAGKKRKLK